VRLVETGRDLDVAVGGDGWLAVQAPDGSEAYVRTASMNVDALGMLRAGNGMPIMGNGGPIAVPPQQTDRSRRRRHHQHPRHGRRPAGDG
jgi:flagellar basal-body rod protein FlgF